MEVKIKRGKALSLPSFLTTHLLILVETLLLCFYRAIGLGWFGYITKAIKCAACENKIGLVNNKWHQWNFCVTIIMWKTALLCPVALSFNFFQTNKRFMFLKKVSRLRTVSETSSPFLCHVTKTQRVTRDVSSLSAYAVFFEWELWAFTLLRTARASVGHRCTCRAHAVGAPRSIFLFCSMSAIYKQWRNRTR